MAKDVDLSSKEWTDIVFEGKNKEFGAYTLRSSSDRRHNKAMLYVILGLVVILIGGFCYGIYADWKAEQAAEAERERLLAIEQELAMMAEEEEEEPEEEIQERVEEQLPEVLPEEVLNTIKSTELLITEDEEVTEEIKSQDELKETETAIGATTFDQGVDDINVTREYKDEIIVEEKKPVEDNQVFEAVEQMPQFPGGEAELMKYLSSHIKYPTIAAENGVQGRVIIKFVVTKSGKVGDVVLLRGKDPDLDKEAIRVAKSLPDFIPGKMNGQPVNVWYTLPVQFRLQQ